MTFGDCAADLGVEWDADTEFVTFSRPGPAVRAVGFQAPRGQGAARASSRRAGRPGAELVIVPTHDPAT